MYQEDFNPARERWRLRLMASFKLYFRNLIYLNLQEDIAQGILKMRPMHQQHTFETALVCTEAFKNSAEPPRFDRML